MVLVLFIVCFVVESIAENTVDKNRKKVESNEVFELCFVICYTLYSVYMYKFMSHTIKVSYYESYLYVLSDETETDKRFV